MFTLKQDIKVECLSDLKNQAQTLPVFTLEGRGKGGRKLKTNFSQLFPLSLFLVFSFSLNQQSLQNWNKTEWKLCQNVYTLSVLFTYSFFSPCPRLYKPASSGGGERHLKIK
jgi:hypothetical protein